MMEETVRTWEVVHATNEPSLMIAHKLLEVHRSNIYCMCTRVMLKKHLFKLKKATFKSLEANMLGELKFQFSDFYLI